MMKPLRKRHLQVWTAWALLIPLAIIFAWLVIPGQEPVKLLQSTPAEVHPVIIAQKTTESYSVRIRTSESRTIWQLEWINKKPLEYPSAVIYKVNQPGEPVMSNELVGRIEARGNYVFPLSLKRDNGKPLHFILYDFIHEKIIDSIQFNSHAGGTNQ